MDEENDAQQINTEGAFLRKWQHGDLNPYLSDSKGPWALSLSRFLLAVPCWPSLMRWEWADGLCRRAVLALMGEGHAWGSTAVLGVLDLTSLPRLHGWPLLSTLGGLR